MTAFGSCASGTILPKGDFGGGDNDNDVVVDFSDDDDVVDDDDDVESAHDGWAVRGRLSHGLQPSNLLPPILCSNISCYFYCSFYRTWYYTPSALFTPSTPNNVLVFLPLLLLLFWYPGCCIAGTLQAHCRARHNIGYTHSAVLDVRVLLWLCGCLTRAIMQ